MEIILDSNKKNDVFENTNIFHNKNSYFTYEEVELHNKIDDCWIIAHGKVYNVTNFLYKHPAGHLSILRKAGKDCTIDFDFHSFNAKNMWKLYGIGYIQQNNYCIIN